MKHLTPRKTLGTILLVISLAGIMTGAAALAGRPISLRDAFPGGGSGIGPLAAQPNGLDNSFGLLGKSKFLLALGDPATSGLATWPGAFDTVATTFDLDGDGQDEIIGHSNDSHVYVFRQDGRVLARLANSYPDGWYQERVLNAVGAAILRPGEPGSIVVANGAAFIQVWRYNAAQSTPDRFVMDKVWEDRADACHGNPGMDARPVIDDADGDGILEIFISTEERGLFAFNADGTERWNKCWGGGNASPVIADLEDDGKLEVIFASDGGVISVLDANTGTPKWTFNAADPVHGIKPGAVSVSPAVGELDGQSPKEVVFTARYAPRNNPDEFGDFHMAIFAVHGDVTTGKGSVLWMRQPDWAHPLSYTHLLIEDVDQDGRMDIFGMDWNTIGHKPGNWQNLGLSHLFRLDHEGEDVWVVDLDVWWSNKDIFLFDSDEDGTLELFVNGAYLGNDGMWRINVMDGERDGFLSARPWKIMRGPVVANLRNDDATQIVFPVGPKEGLETHGAILVFELDRGG